MFLTLFEDGEVTHGSGGIQQVNFIQQLWAPGAVVTTGGYDRESGLKVAEETGQLIGYGMKFLANVRPFLASALAFNL